MKKSISVNKKVGRPKKKGGIHPVTALRLSPELGRAVDKWAAGQDDEPSRSEALRRLVEFGLTVGTKASPSHRLRAARADRAKELATKVIEKIIDPAAPPEERAQRRRRLTKGPEEFREARVDRLKK
jgi:hypothetical protein